MNTVNRYSDEGTNKLAGCVIVLIISAAAWYAILNFLYHMQKGG
jgi:hypothetical protein